MEKKRQHIIPKCYQRAWCDPETPALQTPYIWIVSKDGKEKKRKSPEKAFVDSDVYTIRLANGDRELMVEDTLAEIESKFVDLIKRKVKSHSDLDGQDKANLCVFAAAMFSRVDPQGEAYEKFIGEIHERVLNLEKAHNARLRTSLETASKLLNARGEYVAMSLDMLARLYYSMYVAIFVAPSAEHFITSDNPTVWYDPDACRRPPFFRSPGLAYERVEVTMPLTPQYALFLSHNQRFQGYRILVPQVVQEFNRRTRFHCDEFFISWKGEVCAEWFDPGTPPEDRWENTPEGKLALQRQKGQR